MLEPPTAAEVKKAHLDADDPGYYRFNFAAMPVMVVTMAWAGAVVEEAGPAWPTWPPKGTSPTREEMLRDALWDKSLDAKLTVNERRATISMRATYAKIQATASKHKGKVPSFKFASNDGYIVTKTECAVIAAKLRTFANNLTAAQLQELEKLYRKSQQPLVDAAKQRGETIVLGDQGLGLTLDEYKAWIVEWATYNEVASRHRGYSVN
jgi:hypothetical protein